MTKLQIPPNIIANIKQHALDSMPNECCGILFGTGAVVTYSKPIENVHPDPANRYQMDATASTNAIISAQKNKIDVVALYHSHPTTEAYPSGRDIKSATANGWTEPYHIIITLLHESPQIRVFTIAANGKVTEIKHDHT